MRCLNFIAITLSTFFYLGYLPFIPGTFGSLAGVFLFYLLKDNTAMYVLVTLVILALGFCLSGQVEQVFKKKDPSFVVIDEVGGMLLSLAFIPAQPIFVCLAFFLFRLLDTLKPYPADKLQRLQGSVGIMSDDIVAGIYANLILQVVLRLVSFKIS